MYEWMKESCYVINLVAQLAVAKIRTGLQVCERTDRYWWWSTDEADMQNTANAPNYNASFTISLVRVLLGEGTIRQKGAIVAYYHY